MAITGSTFVRVAVSPGGGWDVREPGNPRALCRAETQLEAVRLASAVMSPTGGQVRVLNAEGFLVDTFQVDSLAGSKRWWYLPNWGIFLALGLLTLGSGVFRLIDGENGVLEWLTYVQVAVAVGLVVCALASRRWRRRMRAAAVRRIEQQWSDR